MNRRQVLTLAALSVPLSGCVGGGSGGQNKSATQSQTPTDTDPGCWPSMCAGTQIVEVVVDSGFDRPVIMDSVCRDEPVSIPPGESACIDRQEEGEACRVTLSVDGEELYSDYVGGYERRTLTIRSDGTIDEEGIVYSRGPA